MTLGDCINVVGQRVASYQDSMVPGGNHVDGDDGDDGDDHGRGGDGEGAAGDW